MTSPMQDSSFISPFIPPLASDTSSTSDSMEEHTSPASPPPFWPSISNFPAEGSPYADLRLESPGALHSRSSSPRMSPGLPGIQIDETGQSEPISMINPPLTTLGGVGGRVVSFAEEHSVIPVIPHSSPDQPSPSPTSSTPRHEFRFTYDFRDVFFNLSSPKFGPMRFTEHGTLEYVLPEELSKPATNPPIFQLRVICPSIPHWPIKFQPNVERLPPSGKLSPITLGDILARIYYCMNLPIREADWNRLPEGYKPAVVNAFHKRCKLSGAAVKEETSKGVKRIDFCGELVWLKNLISTQTWHGLPIAELVLFEGI